MRVGIGFDVHRLAPGRKCVLGGVEIPFGRGPEGHSDGDVLLHAVMDALLGAIAAGDIGEHFPDADERYRGISSVVLLREVMGLVRQRGYAVGNLDCVILAERPKISPHKSAMAELLARELGIEPSAVGLKATTAERLGFVGREEGIAAQAVVSLRLAETIHGTE